MNENLYRAAVRGFDPYEWELSSEAVAERYGLRREDVLRFDLNTTPFLPANYAPTMATLTTDPAALGMPTNEYPDTTYAPVVRGLIAYTGFAADSIVVGAGADEILDMVAKVFVDNGDWVVTTTPTYAMYPIVTAQMGGRVADVPRRADFSIDADAIVTAVCAYDAKIVWLCNPNNPTGNAVPVSDIATLLELLDGRAAVVVDEAYWEMVGATAATLIGQHPNLIVVRTMSKLFSLAGARVGYSLSTPEVAAMLNRVRPPNSVSTISVSLAAAALADPAPIIAERVSFLRAERERMAAALSDMPGCREVYGSVTNFVLARFEEGQRTAIADRLLAHGMVVRRPGHPVLRDCLRISVRTVADDDRLIAALKDR